MKITAAGPRQPVTRSSDSPSPQAIHRRVDLLKSILRRTYPQKQMAWWQKPNRRDVHEDILAAAKKKDWIAKIGSTKVLAKNVVTMVGKLTNIRANVPEKYDFLSEIAHPNGVGAVGFFADIPQWHRRLWWQWPRRTCWPAVDHHCGIVLVQFEEVMDRIEAGLPALSALGGAQAPKIKLLRQNLKPSE
jgi:hypothetical protein